MAPLGPPSRRLVCAGMIGLALLAACAPGTADRDGVRPAASSPVASHPVPPTASPGPTPTGPPGRPQNPTLAGYLARLPVFPPAPVPEKVTVPHVPGRAAWVTRVPTTHRVAFLTIDDGIVAHPDAVALMRAAGIPVTLFLTTNTISPNKEYFAELAALGATIESHTVSHPQLPRLGYEGQHDELCHAANLLERWYGERPRFFRPPYGEKNDTTLRAAHDCGLSVGFGWSETVNNGVVRFQTPVPVIAPGDIILMHFRTTFPADFIAALRAIAAAGLVPALLEDYVTVTDRPPQPGPRPSQRP